MKNNQTVGKIASELSQKDSGSIDPRELQRATEQEYLDNLVWCVKHAKKQINCATIEGHDFCKDRPAIDGSFYVAALIKKEKLLHNVIRNYFVPTISCPTPHFDQTVYRYDHEKDDIEYLWTVPDQETCEIFRENKHIIVPEEQGLLKMILSYYDGSLFRLCKKLNGEVVETPSIILERLD